VIDLHTHILPAVDDGAPDLETALAMGEEGEKQGLKVIAATPHFDLDSDWGRVQKKTEELQKELTAAGIAVELVAGAELLIDPAILEMAASDIPTYGNKGNYCLIEFPFSQIPLYIEEVLFSLLAKGITPIIAHPERYLPVVADPNIVLAWLRQGSLIQMNSGSILGRFGSKVQRTAEIMLKHNMVQLLGSDAHGLERRPLNLAAGFLAAKKVIGGEAALKLVQTHPAAILRGERFRVEQPREYKRRRRFRFF